MNNIGSGTGSWAVKTEISVTGRVDASNHELCRNCENGRMDGIITTDFHEICLQDRAWIERCRDPEENPFTALSFPSLFTWRRAYGLYVAGNEDAFVVRSRHDQGFFCPCGTAEECRKLADTIIGNEQGTRVVYLTEKQTAFWADRGFTIRLREDLSEYLASTSALALHGGHESNSYKMKCRHFKKQITYRIEPIDAGNIEKLMILAERLRTVAAEADKGDTEVLMSEIDSFRKLNLYGLLLETEDGKTAFILGYENKPGMFTMTMSKHDPALPPETTALLVHEMAVQLEERYPLINIEEDLGIPGLRRAKMLYSPVGKLDVYEAVR